MTDKHAILSPSSSHRWSVCVAAPAMERGLPNTDSRASRTGTAAHELAALCLKNGPDCQNPDHHIITNGYHNQTAGYIGREMTNGVAVDEKMATDVQGYVDYVRALSKNAQIVSIEHTVDISHITGEEGAEGTADCILLMNDGELVVVDYKNGYRDVDPELNTQMAMYASGAVHELDLLYDIKGLRTVTYQPSKGGAKEYVWEKEKYAEVTTELSSAAEWATRLLRDVIVSHYVHSENFNPGVKQCEWCKAKTDCAAHWEFLRKNAAPINIEFENLTAADVAVPVVTTGLGVKLDIVPMLRSLCDAIEATASIELQAGREVVGADGPYKLVAGRAGARKWRDEVEAELVLKGMRLPQDVMYDKSLISPTTADKLHKKDIIGKRQWPKIEAIITRAEGKPRVAKATDPGEAIKVQVDFEPVVDNPK